MGKKKLHRTFKPCPKDGLAHHFVFDGAPGTHMAQGRCRKCGQLSVSHRISDTEVPRTAWGHQSLHGSV
jgi:hypothetical protein